MNDTPRLHICTGNHRKIEGISDHITLITDGLEEHGIRVEVGPTLCSNCPNLIIEEFSNPKFISYLKKFKNENQNVKLILLMTELPSSVAGKGIVLNEFMSKNATVTSYIWRAVLWLRSFTQAVISPEPNKLRNLIAGKIRTIIRFFSKYIKLFPSVPNAARNVYSRSNPLYRLMRGFKFKIKKLTSALYLSFVAESNDHYYMEYMALRGKKLVEVIDLFDAFWDMHPIISANMYDLFAIRSVSLLPKLSNPKFIPIDNPPSFVSTGLSTVYRSETIRKLRERFKDAKFNQVGFESDKTLLAHSLMTLNIPQSAEWPMSSPVRVYRSIQAGLLPVMFKKYNDHPIEKCTFSLDEVIEFPGKMRELNFDHFYRNIEQYNQFCGSIWTEISERLRADFAETTYVQKSSTQVDDEAYFVPILERTTGGHNIVSFGSTFYAVPLASGNVNLAVREEREALKIRGFSLDETIGLALLEEESKSILCGTLLEEESISILCGTLFEMKEKFSVVKFKRSLYLLSDKLGAVEVDKNELAMAEFKVEPQLIAQRVWNRYRQECFDYLYQNLLKDDIDKHSYERFVTDVEFKAELMEIAVQVMEYFHTSRSNLSEKMLLRVVDDFRQYSILIFSSEVGNIFMSGVDLLFDDRRGRCQKLHSVSDIKNKFSFISGVR